MFIQGPKTLLSIVGLFALFLAGQVEAGKNCGGLNQKSCWSVNPKKWCDGNLKYKPTGVPGKGTCVKRKSKPKPKPKKDCGGLGQSSCWHVNPTKWCEGNLRYKPAGVPGKGTCVTREKAKCGNLDQQSCWHVNPTRWCNGNLKYKPTGVPGQGTCILRVSKDDLREVAASVVDRMKTIGEGNPLRNLRDCLNQPENLAALREALDERSANGVNALLRQCGASPDALRSYGADVLGSFINSESAQASNVRHVSSASAAGSNVRSLSSESEEDSKAWHLSVAGIASGVAQVGTEGGVGYRVVLEKNPEARFYLTGGLSVGPGLAVGGDLAVSLSHQSMPEEHWARDTGVSVSYTGKALYGGGVSVDFSKDSVVPSGFTISGGGGGGVEAGVVTGLGTLYLHNY